MPNAILATQESRPLEQRPATVFQAANGPLYLRRASSQEGGTTAPEFHPDALLNALRVIEERGNSIDGQYGQIIALLEDIRSQPSAVRIASDATEYTSSSSILGLSTLTSSGQVTLTGEDLSSDTASRLLDLEGASPKPTRDSEIERGISLGTVLKAGSTLVFLFCLASICVWLFQDVILINPFLALLFSVASPGFFLMGVVANRRANL